MEADFVVIGGGIAGVSCIEALSYLKPESRIILLSESPVVKAVTNFQPITKLLTVFDVIEQDLDTLSTKYQNLTVYHDSLTNINSHACVIKTKNDKEIKYKFLCLCMGGKPKIIPHGEDSPYILGIRDTDSVSKFTEKLKSAKKLAIVGNGGIATELIYKLQNVDIDWIIKDKHTSATFVDPGAAEFLKSSLEKDVDLTKSCSTRLRYKQDSVGSGAALGPDWYTSFALSGAKHTKKSINVHFETEILNFESSGHNLKIQLSNGNVITSDLLISATGVLPKGNTIITDVKLELSNDFGIKIDEFMCTNLPNVFAAGDICTPNWPLAKHWFPMKLWSQARNMGCHAAKCMVAKMDNEVIMQDFTFELFAHSTNFFGYKVVLLGLFNGQKLGNDYECLIRTTKGVEFIKFVLQNNRLQGAILIGDTDLAETCENLILNQLDLSPYGDDILNPDIDIEDYFD